MVTDASVVGIVVTVAGVAAAPEDGGVDVVAVAAGGTDSSTSANCRGVVERTTIVVDVGDPSVVVTDVETAAAFSTASSATESSNETIGAPPADAMPSAAATTPALAALAPIKADGEPEMLLSTTRDTALPTNVLLEASSPVIEEKNPFDIRESL